MKVCECCGRKAKTKKMVYSFEGKIVCEKNFCLECLKDVEFYIKKQLDENSIFPTFPPFEKQKDTYTYEGLKKFDTDLFRMYKVGYGHTKNVLFVIKKHGFKAEEKYIDFEIGQAILKEGNHFDVEKFLKETKSKKGE